MPRRTRMYISGFPYHLVQRGNNRQACFFEDENYWVFLRYMKEVLPRYGNSLHAYCLMTNHVHLLITPRDETSISSLMKVVSSRYATYINKKYSRTGTLWEGRHKSSAIDTEDYLLKCYRYIELNPVTAGMVASPEEYAWSSYHSNAWSKADTLLSPHEIYLRLGDKRSHRCDCYRELFESALSQKDLHTFRKAALHSMPVGSDRFVALIEHKLGRKVGHMAYGRPRKQLVKN